jgi:hypothetical protein
MHFIFVRPIFVRAASPAIAKVAGGMYRRIAGAVTNKSFGIAGLPPELDELSFRRNPPRKCAHSSRRRRHLART